MIAKAELATIPFAAILLDTSVPDIDSRTLRVRLSRLSGRGTAIVVLAANPELGKACREDFGPGPLLCKPPKQSDLFDALRALSVNPEARHTSTSDRRRIAKARNPLRVLLAEDNAVNVRLATLLVEKQGHVVTAVGTGRAAVEALEHGTFDVVLMDMQLPEMDGLDATAAIRQCEQSQGKHVRIIALTANAMKGDRERCLEAGMDDYISKPLNPQELFNALERVPTDSCKALDSKTQPVFCVADALATLNGDIDDLLDLINIFIETSPAELSRISNCLNTDNAQGVRDASHSLKGSAAVLGAHKIMELASLLEGHDQEALLPRARETFESLKFEMDRLLEALSSFDQHTLITR